MSRTPSPLLALVGPTASGKTDASVAIAERLGAEIVSIDPALVYRGMDVWTGKPTAGQRARVRHHLLDLTDPTGPFSVVEFQRLAGQAVEAIRAEGRPVLLVGASGLYYRAVVDGLSFPATEPATRRLLEAEARVLGAEALYRRLASFDPEAAGRIEPANARRTVRALEVAAVTGRPFSEFSRMWGHYPASRVRVAGVAVSREALRLRIRDRVEGRFDSLVDETRGLLGRGFGAFVASSHLIGYAEAAAFLEGRLDEEAAKASIAKRDRGLARRQVAWFRRDPRVRWFDAGEGGAVDIAGELASYLEEALRPEKQSQGAEV
jgi:tRNA dimethylallyltransferase